VRHDACYSTQYRKGRGEEALPRSPVEDTGALSPAQRQAQATLPMFKGARVADGSQPTCQHYPPIPSPPFPLCLVQVRCLATGKEKCSFTSNVGKLAIMAQVSGMELGIEWGEGRGRTRTRRGMPFALRRCASPRSATTQYLRAQSPYAKQFGAIAEADLMLRLPSSAFASIADAPAHAEYLHLWRAQPRERRGLIRGPISLSLQVNDQKRIGAGCVSGICGVVSVTKGHERMLWSLRGSFCGHFNLQRHCHRGVAETKARKR